MQDGNTTSSLHSGDDSLNEKQEDVHHVLPGESAKPTALGEPLANNPAAATSNDDWEYVTGFKLAIVIIAVTAACFLMLLDTAIVVTAIPRITTDFHSLEDIGWYGSAYLLAACALQPMAGKIFNRYNSKWAFIVFVAIFELGSVLCGAAINSKMLIVGRAVGGIGGSGLINGALTIIAACLPLEKRALYMGIMFGISQLGILLGPLIGGALTQYATWRWCFYINLPIGGLVILLLALIAVPDRRLANQKNLSISDTLQSFDLPGFGIFAATAVMFLLALEWGGTTYRWGSGIIIGLFCGSAVALAIFTAWEYRRGDTAMLPLSMLKRRVVWASCFTMLFLAANMMSTSYYMAIYFQSVRGISPSLSGVFTLPAIMSQIIASIVSGALVNRFGYYLPFVIICGVLASIGSGLISTLTPHTSAVAWVFYQIIAGLGRGCGLQMPILAIQSHLEPALVSSGMAAIVFSQSFGGALFLAFDQLVFTDGLASALPHFAPNVDAQAVIDAGATGIHSGVFAASLPGILLAYSQAVNHVFYLITGASAAICIFGWGVGWKSVKKTTPAVSATATEA